MNERKREDLPIGYWLRRADQLLTARVDAVQRENGLTRLAWQTLNVIRETSGAGRERLAVVLAPFAAANEVASLLSGLVERGFLSEDATGFALTAEGSRLYERALAAQKIVRDQAFEGIGEREYEIVVGVLRRVVENLERNPDCTTTALSTGR